VQQVNLSTLRHQVDEEEFFALVAYAFLEGWIFKSLSLWKESYIGEPKDVLKKGNFVAKVSRIISTLQKHNCYTKKSILEVFKTNPYFLLDCIILWVGDKDKEKIKSQWPPK
jgi:hypothetical protein